MSLFNTGRLISTAKKCVGEFTVNFDPKILMENAARVDFPFCESPSIHFHGSQWILRIYPNGYDTKTRGHIKVVVFGHSVQNLKIDFSLSYFSSDDFEVLICQRSCTLSNESPVQEIIAENQSPTKSDVEKGISYFVNNDNLTYVLLFFLNESEKGLAIYETRTFNTVGLKKYLYDRMTSDVDIVVDGTHIPCHKLILSLASPVFKVMFENQMQESASNEIVISDFSEDVVRSMLRCVYDRGAIQTEMEKYADQLLFIADKYELTEIQNIAEHHIISSLTIDTAIEALLSADKFDHVAIKTAAMNFILKNSGRFFKQSNFAQMIGPELVNELLVCLVDATSIEV